MWMIFQRFCFEGLGFVGDFACLFVMEELGKVNGIR